MNLQHIAIWAGDPDVLRDFYQTSFNMKCGERYENSKSGFSSFFLFFESGARIEIMKREDITGGKDERGMVHGLAHFALSAGGREAVDQLTERLRLEGVRIVSEPRVTGDGYYESVILDPEGNHIEITE